MPATDLWDLKDFSLEPALKSSKKRIQSFKNKHLGQRCFIIGNGPSLNKTDLTLIQDEYTFGLNRIYLNFEKMRYVPTYYVAVNPYVIEQSKNEILSIPAPKFISHAGIPYLPGREDILFVRELGVKQFSEDLSQGWLLWATVTFCAMQVAYYMGFQEVILVGIDHYFVTEGKPDQLVTSKGPDPNHFAPDYFGPGMRWQLPDLEASEIVYKMAKKVFEHDGRKILDATVDGHLQVFPKVSFEEVAKVKA